MSTTELPPATEPPAVEVPVHRRVRPVVTGAIKTMSTIELKPPPTAGMRAYAVWHGMTLEHVQDEWASVPQADRMRAKWEAVGAAVEAADRDSRRMFVARLENMQQHGDHWLTVQAVLALLNDCDMLAARERA